VAVAVQLPAERVEEACIAAALLLAQLSPGGADTHWLTAADPLPPPLLLAARICCLAEAEVTSAARALAGEPVSEANEHAALLLLREAIAPLLEAADPFSLATAGSAEGEGAEEPADCAGGTSGPAAGRADAGATGEGTPNADGAQAAAAVAIVRAIDSYCNEHEHICNAALARIDAMLMPARLARVEGSAVPAGAIA
jgi:hypothetical protein